MDLALNNLQSLIYHQTKPNLTKSKLVGFYGIITLLGYLMTNSIYTYIKYIIC